MSFQLFCQACGAPSSPSVGVCPFCKGLLAASKEESHPTLGRIRQLFDEGHLEDALHAAAAAEKEGGKLATEVGFLLFYAKILIEAEGPSSKIRALLTKAHLAKPDSTEIADYLDLIEAKGRLNREAQDLGEKALKKILSRSPMNAHALFLLGSHLFWVESQREEAIRLLQRCVNVRPNFLRAWACLAAVYTKHGDTAPAQFALQKCLALEKNPAMRAYFEKMLSQTLSRAA
jgi:predicted Zn-dependent protease